MEVVTKKRMQVFSGRGYPELAKAVVDHLGMRLGAVDIHEFSNGETYVRFQENIRGSDVFLIQTHCSPVNNNIWEQLIMIDAAKRASAKRIIAVCPFYGYAPLFSAKGLRGRFPSGIDSTPNGDAGQWRTIGDRRCRSISRGSAIRRRRGRG
jgi:hypothetical protein